MLIKHIVKQSLLLKNVGVMSRAPYHGGTHVKMTMNDMPVPQGDWNEQHSRQNAKYNAILLVGILTLAGTIGVVKSTDIIDFNASPPTSLD